MAGELWRGLFQIGKETTAGTAVAATRKIYTDPKSKSALTHEREIHFHPVALGARDNQRAVTAGIKKPGGMWEMPLSASEIIELLLMGVKGAVTPTQPAPISDPTVYLWTFVPGATALDAATVEWNDGANPWRAIGANINKLTFSGAVGGENKVKADLLAMDYDGTANTGGLTDRSPDYIEGWESKLYIDALGGTPGTTAVDGTLINWEVEINNQLAQKHAAKNAPSASSILMGYLEVTAKLTFEASQSAALAAITALDAVTQKLVRLEFGQNTVISNTYKKFVKLDLPGAWSAVNLSGEDADTRVYELSYSYLYDSTNTFGFQVTAQNTRATAY